MAENAGRDCGWVFGDCGGGETGAGSKRYWADIQVIKAEEPNYKALSDKFILKNDLQDRFSNLDILRGLAALAVCLFHFDRDSLFNGTFYSEIARFGYLGVDVFFVISGFVIPLSLAKAGFTLQGIWAFWMARFLRLYPAYFATALLAVGLWYLSMMIPGFRGTAQPDLGFEKVFANLTMTCDFLHQGWYVVVAWTLAIEAQYYVLVALTFPLLTNTKHLFRIFTILFWLGMPLAVGVGPTVFTWAALFGMGLLIFLHERKLLSEREFWIFLLIAVVVQFQVKDFFGALVGLSTVLAIRFIPQISCHWLIWIGSISYSFYLLHPLIGGRVMNFCERFPNSIVVQIIAVPLALFVSIIAAYLFFRAIELPSHQLSRALRNKV
jgi:peptidoglycan/LPS O-acetylase OafA/YrhL